MNSSKAAIIAGAFLAIVSSMSAQARGGLDSGFHGNTNLTQTYQGSGQTYQASPRLSPPDAHSAYAHVHPVAQPLQQPGNSLLDKIHGQAAQ